MSEEETAKLLLYLCNFTFPVILIPLSIPMVKRKIAPNLLYGFRTKKTLSDEKIWYEANAYAGRQLVAASIVTLVGLLLLLPLYGVLATWPFLILSWVFVLIPLTVALVRSFSHLGTL